MRKIYSAVLALSFVVACDKLEDTINNTPIKRDLVQSIEAKADRSKISLNDPDGNPCNGPPSIQHLFDSYEGMKNRASKSGKADYPIVKRVYTIAEAEMERARQMLDLCKKNQDSPLAQFHYISANQFAISAISWMFETTMRIEEPGTVY